MASAGRYLNDFFPTIFSSIHLSIWKEPKLTATGQGYHNRHLRGKQKAAPWRTLFSVRMIHAAKLNSAGRRTPQTSLPPIADSYRITV
jgi:hypothetical protein